MGEGMFAAEAGAAEESVGDAGAAVGVAMLGAGGIPAGAGESVQGTVRVTGVGFLPQTVQTVTVVV